MVPRSRGTARKGVRGVLRMKFIGYADKKLDSFHPELFKEPHWLEAIDLNAEKGRGVIWFTSLPDKAMLFTDYNEVRSLYQSVPKDYPFRDDGKPNKPLTAFLWEIEQVPEDKP
jgi:hypothetical protein